MRFSLPPSLSYSSLPLPSPFLPPSTQVSRFTGQPCFSSPHVVLFVFSILVILSIVAPLPIFFLVITCKRFRVGVAHTLAGT